MLILTRVTERAIGTFALEINILDVTANVQFARPYAFPMFIIHFYRGAQVVGGFPIEILYPFDMKMANIELLGKEYR